MVDRRGALGTLANFEYSPMQFPVYIAMLKMLAQMHWLFEISMTIGALGTLAFEIGYPFAIWRPALRSLWLWIAVLLHLGIGMFMGLRTFSLMMLGFNLAFVATETVRWGCGRSRHSDGNPPTRRSKSSLFQSRRKRLCSFVRKRE